MAICPNGHYSAADDYCDACGQSIALSPGSDSARASGKHHAGRPGPMAGPSQSCQRCGSVSAGQFCERCGLKFRARRPFAPLSQDELDQAELSQPRPPQAELSQPRPPQAELSQPRPPQAELSQPRPPQAELSQPRPPQAEPAGSSAWPTSWSDAPSPSAPPPAPSPSAPPPAPSPSAPPPARSGPPESLF